jgi:hypothetical protein
MTYAPEHAEEIHVVSLLERLFPILAQSYKSNLDDLYRETSGGSGELANLRWQNDHFGSRLFFRLDFTLPTLCVLSESLSRFKKLNPYPITVADAKYHAELAIIPVYLANLNMISCIKLWNKQAAGYFAPSSSPLRGPNIFWRFDHTGSAPAEYSSLNFVLRRGALEGNLSDSFRTSLLNYFQNGFWSLPKPGFTCCAHIIHSHDNITCVLKAAKTIYIIKRLHKESREELVPGSGSRQTVQRIELEAMGRDGCLTPITVYVPTDVVERILELGPDPVDIIMNGLVYERKDKVQRDNLRGLNLLSVCDLLRSDADLSKAVVGLLAAERFRSSDSIGYIGSASEFKPEVERIKRLLANRCSYITSDVTLAFDEILQKLFPVVVRNGESIYFAHPAVLSALLSLGLEDAIEEMNSTTLVAFLDLLDRLRSDKLTYFLPQMEYFRKLKVRHSELLHVLQATLASICLSQKLAKYF